MAEAAPGPEVTRDALLGGTVALLQPRRGHRAGTDAVLLARLCGARDGERVVDLGSASGAVGLMIAADRPGARLLFVERDPALVELCRHNIALNGLGGRASTVEADVFAPAATRREAGLVSGSADLVVTNPPFLDADARGSPDAGRRAAHVMSGGGLTDWLGVALDLLRARGRLCLIHRADRLGACLQALSRGFGSLVLVPVQPGDGRDATRIVVSAVKGGRAALSLRPALVLHGPDGRFSAEAEALHRGDAVHRAAGPSQGAVVSADATEQPARSASP